MYEVHLFTLYVIFQPKIDQLQEDVKLVRPAVEQTRQGQTKNPDVDRLEEDCNRLTKRWGNCCMQVILWNDLYTTVFTDNHMD